MDIKSNILSIKSKLPKHVKLVAVSKTKPNEDILEAYQAGQKFFGENKVQDLEKKYAELPKDIQWHFIGHLQTNKVKYIAPFVSLIHAVDSLKLLNTISKEAVKNNRTIDYLFQLHIADEESKFGLSFEELEEIIISKEFKQLSNVNLIGLMGMATYTDDIEQIKKEFRGLKTYFDQIKQKYFVDKHDFNELSMGMSSDFEQAVEQGSTMVRIGSTIFGERS
ncbi:MAG: YggS family pyridoxal phosphate-dependent enzyme [Chloroflexia bacterium]|nr:YggS family pyridoxal phosphate-dependent enzyme [Chloroflexia bacterium]